MKYKFTPKGYSEALGFFFEIPFYSFMDFIHKKEVILDSKEIISIEKFTDKAKICKVDYKVEKFDGWFLVRRDLDLSKFIDVKVSNYRKYDPIDFVNFKSIAICFLKSPLFATLLFTFVYGSIFINYRKIFFPGLLNPTSYINTYCDSLCVNSTANFFSMVALILGLAIGEIIINLFFYFKISLKIRNAGHYNFVRNCALALIFINISIINKFVSVSMEDNNWKKAYVNFHRTYNPNYFHDPVNRVIASKILDEKRKKNIINK